MSPYLEDQFQYISHLYRRPLAFTEKCDHNNFDYKYMRAKNCTDACVTLRMNDRVSMTMPKSSDFVFQVGGRRRFGFMRGCLSDIQHYNRTAIRLFDYQPSSLMGDDRVHEGRSSSNGRELGSSVCSLIRLRDLFASSDRFAFDAHDHVVMAYGIHVT